METMKQSDNPDFFSTKEECIKCSRLPKKQTNPKYKNFTQHVYTAGDESQFRLKKRNVIIHNEPLMTHSLLQNNVYNSLQFDFWEGFSNLE